MVGAARNFTSVDLSMLKLEIENGMIKKIKIIIKKKKESKKKVWRILYIILLYVFLISLISSLL